MSEGKKGRVICAWCKGDMGEAETELDTHGCCLGCLKLALREVDEELGPLEQGQAAVAASSRGGAAELPQGTLATGEGGQSGRMGMFVSGNGR